MVAKRRGKADVLHVIADAARSRSTTLSLADMALSSLPPVIGTLAALTELDLSGNELATVPPEIAALTGLAKLDLSRNRITELPSEIQGLTALTHLDLTSNQLTTLPLEIATLAKLTVLNLGFNKLTALPRAIETLADLETLTLHGNQLAVLPPEIGALGALVSFDLSSNKLTALPDEFVALTSLRDLDLSNNLLAALPPPLASIGGLRRLILNNNQLSELTSEIEAWTELEELSVDENPLSALPPEIGALPALRTLSLHGAKLAALPPQIGVLKQLEVLYLGDNDLTKLPSQIGGLSGLSGLYLHENKLTTLPAEFSALEGLRDLTLSRNLLTEVPSGIMALTSLTRLLLSNNALTVLPGEITRLAALTELNLANNLLTALPAEIAELPALAVLKIDDNPLPASYFDALAQGLDSLRALLESLGGATQPLFEAKLLVTGEGQVGKSWLLASLQGRDPHEAVGSDNTTWGIDRGELALAHPDLCDEEIVLNTWDFGGQEIYRVTHQFFFSQDAIYLLVWNPRAGAEQCRVREWLRTIALRTGTTTVGDAGPMPRARVILVATHAQDAGGAYLPDYGRARMEPELQAMIVDEIAVDSEQGHKIDDLRAMIARHAAALPEMGQPVNERWAKARDAVLELRKKSPWIDFDKFSEVCARHGVRDSAELKSLAWTYLHSLGRAVWYGDGSDSGAARSDEAVLANTVVLDAVWLSRAFVQVLEDEPTKAAGGMLDHRRFSQIWTDHGRAGWLRYKPHEYEILKQVMRRFDVALPTRESQGHRSLVPQLVPVDAPELPWGDSEQAPGSRTIRLSCQLDYEAIGLAPRLIAATEPWHVYENGVGLFWEGGVFLRDTASFRNEGLIRIIGSERPRIDIVVSGEQPAFLMYELFKMLESVSVLGFWKGMTRTYSIGCPTRREDGGFCPTYFDFEAIVRRIKAQIGKPFDCARCDNDWRAETLLSGFEAIAERDTQITDRYMLEDMFNRQRKLAPRLFLLKSLETKLLRPTSWNGVVGHRFKITLLSEFSGQPVDCIEFTLAKKWVKWIGPVTRLASLALTGAAVPLGGDLANQFTESAALLDKLSGLPDGEGGRSPIGADQHGSIRLGDEQLASFAKFLKAIDLDPREHGMDIARGPDNKWYWMSAAEVQAYSPQSAA